MLKQNPQYPKTSIYQHSLKLLRELKENKIKFGKDRPRKLIERDERSVIPSLVSYRENFGTFSSCDIQNNCTLQRKVSNDTIRRCFKKRKYGYFECHKKVLLTKEDLVKRVKFAGMELVGFTNQILLELP